MRWFDYKINLSAHEIINFRGVIQYVKILALIFLILVALFLILVTSY